MGMFDSVLVQLSEDALSHREYKDHGPRHNLTDAMDMLRAARDDFEAVNMMPFSAMPSDVYRRYTGQQFLDGLATLMETTRAYPAAESMESQKKAIEATCENLRDDVAKTLRPLRLTPGSPAQAAPSHDYGPELDELRKQLTDRVSAVENYVQASQEEAVSTVTEDLSTYYTTQAKAHGDRAKLFLYVSGGSGLLLAILVCVLFIFRPTEVDAELTELEQTIEFVRESLARLLVVSLVGVVTAFSLRNYRVNMHLQTLNERREHALKTFTLMQQGVSADARDVIVAELVRAIFLSEDTGYLGDSGDRTVVETPGGALATLAAMRKEST